MEERGAFSIAALPETAQFIVNNFGELADREQFAGARDYALRNAVHTIGYQYSPAETDDGQSAYGFQPLRPIHFLKRHENEEDSTYEWRGRAWNNITLPVYNRAFNAVSRIHSILSARVECSDTTKAWARKADLRTFLSQNAMRLMGEDPNGFLVAETFYSNGEVLIFPALVPIRSVYRLWQTHIGEVLIYKSGKAWAAACTQFFMIFSPEEKTVLSYFSPAKQHEKKIFWQLGGYPAGISAGKNRNHLRSFFDNMFPHADAAANQYSDYQFSLKTASYPLKEYYAIQCQAEGCDMGFVTVYADDGTPERKKCHSCGGSGYTDLTGISRSIRLGERRAFGEDRDIPPTIRWISPPTDAIRFSKEEYESCIAKAEKALYQDVRQLAISGEAKALDKEDMYAWLESISSNYYDRLLLGVFSYAEAVLNANPIEVSVQKPLRPQIETLWELGDTLRQSAALGIPSVLYPSLKKYNQLTLGGDPVAEKRAKFALWADPLAAESGTRKDQMLAMGAIGQDAYEFSQTLECRLDRVQEDAKAQKEEFLSLDFDEILRRVLAQDVDLGEAADAETPAAPAALPTAIVESPPPSAEAIEPDLTEIL